MSNLISKTYRIKVKEGFIVGLPALSKQMALTKAYNKYKHINKNKKQYVCYSY